MNFGVSLLSSFKHHKQGVPSRNIHTQLEMVSTKQGESKGGLKHTGLRAFRVPTSVVGNETKQTTHFAK